MSYQVRITASAEQDMRHNHQWWSEHRSEEQADRWLVGIDKLIASLSSTAGRHAAASEPALRSIGTRQVSFGIGRRPTHRVLYAVRDDVVVIYRVRAFKQDSIGPAELSG